jgi:endonuclease YncB( thermonuclease family)
VGIGKFVVGSLTVLLVVGACNNADEGENGQGPVASEAAAAADDASGGGGSATGDVPISTSGAGSSSVADEIGVIASVMDGDTFALTDGRVVRVLGIDSCEIITHSGLQARSDAQQLLRAGQIVYLRREPGVDRDVYRRHLRYVTTSGGQDFGTEMIGFEHTGVYEGGDASAAYTAQMRRLDDGPRNCTYRPPATSARATPTTTTARPIPPADPDPAPRPAPRPAPDPAPAPEPREPDDSNCHPSYTPCVPDGPDLDCNDIRKLVIVTGPDEFRLDGDDNDGRGCESYG